MSNLVDALGLHGVPTLFMLSNEDVDRYKGSKAVVAIMATDREHPEFKKAKDYFSGLEDKDDIIVITEDHADGPLHERFKAQGQDFFYALVDKSGHTVLQGDSIPSLQDIRTQLRAKAQPLI